MSYAPIHGMHPTLLALISVLIWSSLALANSGVSELSPFLSVGIALCIGGLVGLPRAREWKVPMRTFIVGVAGIFGYHALLFAAFRLAGRIEVNLINYLWPLLIVALSPVYLRGFSLHARHVAGTALGLAGAVLIVTGGGALGFDGASLPGYLLALAAAITWASYSLLTKRLPAFPTGAVGGFCLASGFLSLSVYFIGCGLGGNIALPRLGAAEWASLVFLGIGPMGGAFYTWDAALKGGDPRTIGILSYLTPLLSTGLLVLAGGARFGWASGAALVLIVAGAAVGSLTIRRNQ